MRYQHGSAPRRGRRAPGGRRGVWAAGVAIGAAASAWASAAHAQATATWNGGIGNWSAAGNWSTGVVPNSGTTNVFIDGGKAGIASDVTVDGSYALGALTIDAGDTASFVTGFLSSGPSIAGAATINGTLHVGNTNGNRVDLYLKGSGTQSFGGTGQIVLDSTGNLYNPSGLVLTLGPNLTLRGGNGAGGLQTSAVNQGTILSDLAGTGINIAGAAFTNAGTVQITNGGVQSFNAATSNNSGTVNVQNGTLNLRFGWHNAGVINVGAAGVVNLDGTFASADVGTINRTAGSTVNLVGTLNNAGQTLTLNAATGSWNLNGGTIQGGTFSTAGGAQLIFAPSAFASTFDGVTLASAPTFTTPIGGNVPQLNVKNGLTLANGLSLPATNAFFLFQGSQTLGGTGSIDLGDRTILRATAGGAPGTVLIAPGILIHGSGGSFDQTSSNPGFFVNQGTIRADPFGANQSTLGLSGFTNAGTLQVMAGARMQLTAAQFAQASGTVDVNGLLLTAGNAGSTLTLAGGLLTGGGTVNLSSGTGLLSLGGTLAPGHGIGKLSIVGNVTLTSGSHYAVDVGDPGMADLLAINGNLDLSGTNDSLDVTPAGNVATGQPYLIATYTGTLSGAFDHVTPNYAVTYAPGQVFVTPTPEPGALAALVGIATVGAGGRRRRRRPREASGRNDKLP